MYLLGKTHAAVENGIKLFLLRLESLKLAILELHELMIEADRHLEIILNQAVSLLSSARVSFLTIQARKLCHTLE